MLIGGSTIEMSEATSVRRKKHGSAAATHCVEVKDNNTIETSMIVVECRQESMSCDPSVHSRHRQSQHQTADVGETRKQVVMIHSFIDARVTTPNRRFIEHLTQCSGELDVVHLRRLLLSCRKYNV